MTPARQIRSMTRMGQRGRFGLLGFGGVSPATEDSVQRARSQRPERMTDRELVTEAGFAALFVVAAIALIEIGKLEHVPLGVAAVLLLAFTVLSRFEFEIGAGYEPPT